jgi:hypothetical protein
MKEKEWFGCLDNAFAVCTHRLAVIKRFPRHLNCRYLDIRFSTETETGCQALFLEALLNLSSNNSLAYTVCKYVPHINRYVQGPSHHHPTHKLYHH